MGETSAPTLEDLREWGAPAWLWDGARARAVWANGAGLAYFGCETLFDLIDRPFDAEEPGIQRITSLARSLERGKPQRAVLNFPSSGSAVPIAGFCHLHALPDGRMGVLVVAPSPDELKSSAAPDDIAAAFDILPAAALLVAGDGGVQHANLAARNLLPPHQAWSFGALVGDEVRAGELLARLERAGTVSVIDRIETRNGPRDLRITLKRFAKGAIRALILLDDVTDRRALERRAPAPRPEPSAERARLSSQDEAAFAALGQALDGGALAPPADVSAPPPAAPAPVPEKQEIPRFVSAAIEARPGANLILSEGQIAYANAEARALLRISSLEDLARMPHLATQLDGGRTRLATGQGDMIEVEISSVPVPWQNGPADCITLVPVKAAAAAAEPAREEALAVAEAAEPQPPSHTARETGLDLDTPDAELRAILDTAADGIVSLDARGRIRSFSAGAEAIFGYRTAEVIDKPLADFLAPEARKPLRDYLATLEAPGVASMFNEGREVSAVVKQGGEVPLFVTIGRLQSAKADGTAYYAVLRDVTQWKKSERELREAKEQAEAASRQKSEFLAKISHELRTPLNAILGFSDVMRLERFGEIRNEKYRGYVNDIHASGAHLLALINDLLDLSKVEAGKLELNFTSVNLADAAEHAIRTTQEMATAGRVIVRKSFLPGLPNVVADLRSMRQILINLLSNAIKFTDPGGQVIVSAQLSKSGELKLRVKDTGIGMSEAEVQEALEPFRRISVEGRERQGTGLGLPLTKALAEANRTSFAITSEPRKGTLIEITFPVTRVLAE